MHLPSNRHSGLLGFFASFAIAAVPATGKSIIIRHDRPDSRYIALAKGHDEVCDVGGATGTLIASDWVLTAAHVAESLSPYTSFVTIKGKRYESDSIIIHPSHLHSGGRDRRDLALIHLIHRVTGVTPAELYTGSNEVGMIVTFVGRGQTGNGLTGPGPEDGKVRAANNRLENAIDTAVVFTFHPPGKALDLEGISGPRDSGGPALVKIAGKWQVVGVSSSNIGKGLGECRYGTTEVYARVSTAVGWMRETMSDMTASTLTWHRHNPFTSWPNDRFGEAAASLVNAYNSGEVAKYEAFNQQYRKSDVLASRTPEARAKVFTETRSKYGRLEILEYAQDEGSKLSVLARSATDGRKVVLTLFFDPGVPPQFVGWSLSPGYQP